MTQKQVDMINSLEQNLIAVIGKENASSILEGKDLIKPSMDKVKFAQWMQRVCEKLDTNYLICNALILF